LQGWTLQYFLTVTEEAADLAATQNPLGLAKAADLKLATAVDGLTRMKGQMLAPHAKASTAF
jgi:hypothetical protein